MTRHATSSTRLCRAAALTWTLTPGQRGQRRHPRTQQRATGRQVRRVGTNQALAERLLNPKAQAVSCMSAGDQGPVRDEAVGRPDGHQVAGFGSRRHSSTKSDRQQPVFSSQSRWACCSASWSFPKKRATASSNGPTVSEPEPRQGRPDGAHGEPASDVSLIRRTLVNERSDRAPATNVS